VKTKDISRKYGLDSASFDKWVVTSGVPHRSKMTGLDIEESADIPGIVERFRADQTAKQNAAAAAAQIRAEEEASKRKALASMLITSGFNFDGYTITKYSGYISGDDAVQIDRGQGGLFTRATDVGAGLLEALVHIRRNALAELKDAAYELGCNAVIGVDFDYLTLDPETVGANGGVLYLPYVFGVTANGNAVVIERNATAPADVASASPDQMLVGPPPFAPPPSASTTTAAPSQPGWLTDPTGQHRLRWWDGTQWTESIQD
jgi:uncharacterized protein YbjQ (UPF0145 family)